MTESIKIVAFNSRYCCVGSETRRRCARPSAKVIFILYGKINNANFFCTFPEKAKASEAFDKKISLALENSHQ